MADDEVIAAREFQRIEKILALTTKERPNNVFFETDYAMCSIRKHVALVESLPITTELKENMFFRNSIPLFKLRIKQRH